MNKEIEMSTIDIHLPRYYKGFDVDILLRKMNNKEPLTRAEIDAIDEAQDIYYKKYFEEGRKKAEAWMKAHPGEYTKNVDPGRIAKRQV